ncbi:MAG: alanine dehydrogenase [Chloroflexota bacterium]
MNIGVPREVKDNEYRVAATPAGVEILAKAGHHVLVEAGAGEGSGFTNAEYAQVGAEIAPTHAEAFTKTDLVLKVKEPLSSEYELLRPGLILFTYLHLAAIEELTRELVRKNVTAVAYETVQLADGTLPLLTPMSEVAGRMAVQVGAHYLEKMNGGRGKLLGGVPGVSPCNVVIIGGGTVGINAAQIALGLGAQVTIIDKNVERLRYLSEVLHGRLVTLMSNPLNIAQAVSYADLVIGAVLVPGAKAPNLVTREMVKTMKTGSVVVDVAVDQGGCVETCHPTTHSAPTYTVDGVVHYCVTNMPGAVPRTSTYALSNVTLPYALKLANLGFVNAVKADPALAKGVNVYAGHVTYKAVADAFGMEYHPLESLL